MLATAVVFAGTTWLGLTVRGFALGNLIVAAAWLLLLIPMLRRFRRLCADCP